jgi:hypothetical protein
MERRYAFEPTDEERSMYEINGAVLRLPELGGGLAPPLGASANPDAGIPRRPPLTDAVRPNWWNPPFLPPTTGNGGLLGALQALVNAFGRQIGNGVQQAIGTPREAAFSDASLASTGDPHLSLSGSVVRDGTASPISTTFDSMVSQPGLFSTDAFGDGFTVSTRASEADAQGVTYNQSATAWMDGGRDAVSVNADGSFAVNIGTATVTRATDGSVTIAEANRWGGRLDTTFRPTGAGVDVTAQAHDVALGGTLVSRALQGSTA